MRSDAGHVAALVASEMGWWWLSHAASLAAKAGVARRVFCSDEAPLPAGRFDAVLVDAPCSGSGVLRRFGRTVDFAAGAGDADLDDVLDAHSALRSARDRDAGDADLDDVLDAHAALRRARDRDADARSGVPSAGVETPATRRPVAMPGGMPGGGPEISGERTARDTARPFGGPAADMPRPGGGPDDSRRPGGAGERGGAGARSA